jgi:2-polyprenyl-3-methyl-5-hydroxy-6-metoxy-1,4-benzoquinol methylase
MSKKEFYTEIENKKRFEFGKNWKNFLKKITNERIDIAKNSLVKMLGSDNLSNNKFIDIGCGSGLFSLSARNLGAKVFSFDFDEFSVWCTENLRERFNFVDENWIVRQGSIIDREFVNSLGKFDIVYSWGVLHHTGKMWSAIDNAIHLVDNKGTLFISIYNDQGLKSHFWWAIKWFYNYLPKLLKKPFAYITSFLIIFIMLVKYTLKLKPMVILGPMFNYKKNRGMDYMTDIIDWYGGFPYEFANYDYLIDYIEDKGFKLKNSKRTTSHGCNEIVFTKN